MQCSCRIIMYISNNFNDLDKLREQEQLRGLTDLPQEIMYEIFKFVPEYGHRVSACLHEQSLYAGKVSAYCDFYRYCARSFMEPLDTCIEILVNCLPDSLTTTAKRYLCRDTRSLLFKYLYEWHHEQNEPAEIVIVGILGRLGINVQQLTCVYGGTSSWTNIQINNNRWQKQYVDFYVFMILFESGVITKKEFDRYMKSVTNLRCILQYIILRRDVDDHISRLAIRYFGHVIPELCFVPDKLVSTSNYREYYDEFIEAIEQLKTGMVNK